MNAFTQQALAALVLAGAVAAPAAASVQSDVQHAISGGNVRVCVVDGVATLTGYTDNISRMAARRAALESAGVERVINLISRRG